MKKKIIALTLLLACALTGCATGEDFISEVVRDNNHGMMVYSNHLDKVTMPESARLGEDEFYGISEVIMNSAMGEYAYIDEEYNQFGIDVESYMCDFAENNDKEIVALTTEDKRRWLNDDETFWEDYHWVMKNDIMYVENNEGLIAEKYYFMLVSRNEAIKNALISNGYEWVYDVFKACDDLTLAELENNKFFTPYYSEGLSQCILFYSDDTITISMPDVYVLIDAKYLVELCQRDGWEIIHVGANESCESLTMTTYTEGIDVRVDLFGKDGAVKEMKFTYENALNAIPDSYKPTIIECMKALGCSEDTITVFLKEMPTENGNIDNLYFVVEKVDEENKSLKFFVDNGNL